MKLFPIFAIILPIFQIFGHEVIGRELVRRLFEGADAPIQKIKEVVP